MIDQLPEPIKKGAIQTIAKVVGSITVIPDAMARRFAQGLNDKTDAKAEVWKRVGAAIGDRIIADDELMDRATVSLMGEAYRKQENKEAVAQEAASNLLTHHAAVDSADVPPIEDDWINVFSSHAENASSERLRQMWGRILSGEIRKPGSFSLSTMRFVAELDRPTAEAFDKIGTQIFAGALVREEKYDEDLSPFFVLEEAGLLTVGGGTLTRNFTLNQNGIAHLNGINGVLRLTGSAGAKIGIPSMPLTRVANELLSLLPSFDELSGAKKVAEVVDKTSLK